MEVELTQDLKELARLEYEIWVDEASNYFGGCPGSYEPFEGNLRKWVYKARSRLRAERELPIDPNWKEQEVFDAYTGRRL